MRNTAPEPYSGRPGQELCDPDYRPVALPAALAAVRSALFGHRPDDAALDLRLRQYLALLHATELDAAVRAVDPRITYPAPAPGLEFDFRPAVTPQGHREPLYLAGDPPQEDPGGALVYTWQVVVAGAATTVRRLRPGPATANVPTAYTGGLSAPVPLAGSPLAARFHEGLPDGTSWLVAAWARPARDIGEIAAALDQRGDLTDALFGPAPTAPMATWKALWEAPAPLPYRLGAVLLALAIRTDELRKGR